MSRDQFQNQERTSLDHHDKFPTNPLQLIGMENYPQSLQQNQKWKSREVSITVTWKQRGMLGRGIQTPSLPHSQSNLTNCYGSH